MTGDPSICAPPDRLRDVVFRALIEDLGRGDVTSQALVPAGLLARAGIETGQEMTLAGMEVARATFAVADPDLAFIAEHHDGEQLPAQATVARLSGPARSILAAERVALNFLQRLSGIATLAARAVAAVAGTGVILLDTRKTTPGLRILEKHAARCGGFRSHRGGLDDGILIKDNHISCAGSAVEAVHRARRHGPALLKIQVEIDSLADLGPVMAAGADAVLLDNFTPEQVAEAVQQASGRVVLEASGGIDLDQLARYAATGVDRISVGFVTHSATAADLSLHMEPLDGSGS